MNAPHRFIYEYALPEPRVRVTGVRDGEPLPERTLGPESRYLTDGAPKLRRLQTWIGQLLRVCGFLVLISPLLVVASAFTDGTPVVAFVIIVTAFFAILNLFFLVAVTRFVVGRKVRRAEWVDASGKDLWGVERGEHVVGIAMRLGPSNANVLWQDGWTDDSADAWRIAQGDDFVVLPDDGSDSLIVRLDAPPVLLGSPQRSPIEEGPMAHVLDTDAAPPLRGRLFQTLTIRHGAKVKVHLPKPEHVESLERLDPLTLGGRQRRLSSSPSAPYRGANSPGGLLLRSTNARPLALRILE